MKYDYIKLCDALHQLISKHKKYNIALRHIATKNNRYLKISHCITKLSNISSHKYYNTQQGLRKNEIILKHNKALLYNPILYKILQSKSLSALSSKNTSLMYRILFFFLIANCISQASRTQLFIGLGSSITNPKISIDSKNQMAKNTSSVNASGGYYYNQEQLGNYDGAAKDIRSVYAGIETTIDDFDIFTLRGFITASYSNSVDFGNLRNVRNGNLRQCNTNELPSLTTTCFREQFTTSQPGVTATFNTNPGFANRIASNALMLSYGFGADIGVNIPIHIAIEKISGYKTIALRVGVYLGGGYQFTSYSIGTYDNRTYTNQVPVFNSTNRSQIISNTRDDTLYAAGGGWFFHAGFNFYISNNLRVDIGTKIDTATRESSRWYTQQATNPPINQAQNQQYDPVFFEQTLIQSYSIRMSTIMWYVNMYVLF